MAEVAPGIVRGAYRLRTGVGEGGENVLMHTVWRYCRGVGLECSPNWGLGVGQLIGKRGMGFGNVG